MSKTQPSQSLIKRSDKQFAKNEYLRQQDHEIDDRLSALKSEAMRMIDDVFDPARSQKFGDFFTRRNNELLDGLKSDSRLVDQSHKECRDHAERAMGVCLQERQTYEQRKGQLRNEFEHMTKVYRQSIAPLQMMMNFNK